MMNATLLFLLCLSAKLHVVTAAGLRATPYASRTRKTEKLQLTDDDDIEFFKDEIEHGYLSREDYDQYVLGLQLGDDAAVGGDDDEDL